MNTLLDHITAQETGVLLALAQRAIARGYGDAAARKRLAALKSKLENQCRYLGHVAPATWEAEGERTLNKGGIRP